ncbi:MAG: toxin-antitoxin system HicB family antitoxin [Lentisphaerae bacterium]|nr:toxin-antitoxin system HicB family antitoxin [Lentisphaerota bacterium]
MKTLQLRLPENVHSRVARLSREEKVSINQFIVTSVSNEIVREETRDFFRKAASRFDPKAFADALAAVPDAPPAEGDGL